jgi:hypothetical protein
VGLAAQTSSWLIQTLHHADRKRTEDYILKMLFLLHDLVILAQNNILEFRAVSSSERGRNDEEQHCYEPLDELKQLDAASQSTAEEQGEATEQHDTTTGDREESRSSQELERNLDPSSSCDLAGSRSRSRSSSRSMEDILSPRSLSHGHLVSMIDIGIDRVKSLDVIDRVDDI